MELRQLKYFEKTCECLNFTEAARILCISQSTLSQQIKQLETELDVLLFDRIGKRIVLTEAGQLFLPYARRTLRESEDGKQILCDLQGMQTGLLRIGVTYSLSPLLDRTLTQFTERFPKIRIKITFATSEELMQQLENDRLDFVLSFDTGASGDNFEKIFLFASRLYLVTAPSHPLATKTIVRFSDLITFPFILPAKGFVTRCIIDSVCRKKQIELSVLMEVNDVHLILNLVKNGQLATILTFSAARNENGLVKIPIASKEELSTRAFLFWPQGCYRKKAALCFAEILRQTVQKD